jgi:hypothetical protein
MFEVDFSGVEDATDFTPLPEGTYPCRIDTVEETRTNRGDRMLKVRLVVVSGPNRGRYIFDNLVFSEKAMKRAKLVLSRLGIDVTSKVMLSSELLIGKACRVRVEVEDYVDSDGKERSRNRVVFAGYERAEAEGAKDDGGDEEEPPF